MKRRSFIQIALAVVLLGSVSGVLAACGGDKGGTGQEHTIAVPSDTTNEARALLLLEANGIIKLKDGAGLTATANDIIENPYNVKIIETEAAALPRTLPDVDFAVINGNYALSAGLDASSVLVGESAASDAALEYANIIAGKSGNEGSDKTRALVEVLQSTEVQDFIAQSYSGAVVPVTVPSNLKSDGKAAADKVIKVGASPAPHAEILEFAKPLLAAKGYTLQIIEYSDYIQPNVALSEGELDANYFQHLPYLEDYNKENRTDLISVAKIHFEPLSLYPGKLASLDDLKK
ncbi:MAG: hypothetical protein LBG81_04360 [Coriobacteriaceae bacterium]|jgi:D-methionine transport system substrate-binding protein|nr:hypothetical protein [Coriobacteriaceae bacterium]